MPTTLDRAVYIDANYSSTGFHELCLLNYQESLSHYPGEWHEMPHTHWATYVAGMIQELPPPETVEMVIPGDIPLGAGPNSSTALEMATGLTPEKFRDISIKPLNLARIRQIVEHEYMNVQCGIMDQIVSCVGRAAHALFLDCYLLKWEHIPVQRRDVQFIVIDSRIQIKLADSKYNERHSEFHKAL